MQSKSTINYIMFRCRVKEFRNTYIAHQEQELKDKEKARKALIEWIKGLLQIYRLNHN